jgi:geranylgeranyl diphosphate synthase type I
MNYEKLTLIEKNLEQFWERSKSVAAFNAEMSQYHFSTGGKRLRAMIPLWIFDACGAELSPAIKLGSALEMIHNATLVHDDLQDGDTVRRGKETIWKKWSEAQAINCGDAMFEFATEILTEMQIEPKANLQVIQRVMRGTLQVIEGQAQEFLMKDEAYPLLDRYLEVIRGKTAALMATAVGASLIALEKNNVTINQAEDAAMQMGVLFQLQDDLLDLYGDKGRDRAGSDIAEGKVSALIAICYQMASKSEKEQVGEILRKSRESTTDADIERVMKIIEFSGAKAQVIHQILSIQKNLKDHALSKSEPKIHALLIDLTDFFLKPVEGLLHP